MNVGHEESWKGDAGLEPSAVLFFICVQKRVKVLSALRVSPILTKSQPLQNNLMHQVLTSTRERVNHFKETTTHFPFTRMKDRRPVTYLSLLQARVPKVIFYGNSTMSRMFLLYKKRQKETD